MSGSYGLRTILAILGLVSLVALPAGCGNDFAPGTAAMTVRLVDAPIAGYKEININIKEVRICRDIDNVTDNATDNETDNTMDIGGWVTLATPNKTINLLALTGGVAETLADNVTLPAGHYGQMRLVLGTGNTVKLADDSVHDLVVPSGLQSGIKLIVNFTVEAGTTKDVFIDFDAARSIQLHKTGHSDKYILRPTIRAFDKAITGTISGVLTDNATGTPLAGAAVTAQTFDNASNAAIVRSVTTASDGSYALDLLPIGGTYYVVSQPVAGSSVYEAKASQGIALTADNATAVYSAAFAAVSATGSVTGMIAPTAGEGESDRVSLIQALTTDGSGRGFIIQIVTPTVTDTVESYAFTGIPAGTYSVKGTRTVTDDNGTVENESPVAPVVTVDPAAPVTADLQF